MYVEKQTQIHPYRMKKKIPAVKKKNSKRRECSFPLMINKATWYVGTETLLTKLICKVMMIFSSILNIECLIIIRGMHHG